MGSRGWVRDFLCIVTVISSFSFLAFAENSPTITLAVDASNAPRKMFHAQLRIPAKSGTLTL